MAIYDIDPGAKKFPIENNSQIHNFWSVLMKLGKDYQPMQNATGNLD